MSKQMKKHPAVCHASAIADICNPLKKLDISYFSHVNISHDNKFSALCNKPGFAEHYIDKKYYNADIHMAKQNLLGNYIIWDSIELAEKSSLLLQEAADFGHQHLFTIVEKNSNGSNYYHFATHLKSKNINQVYLAQLELLKNFILHFNFKMNQSKELLTAYDIKFGLDRFNNKFAIEHENQLFNSNLISDDFLNSIQIPSQNSNIFNLSPQQMRCLNLLVLGNSAKQIAASLNLSTRTVEHYLGKVREILNCNNSKELISLYFSKTSERGENSTTL